MHDPELCKKNPFLNTYIESIHVGGFITYETIRQSNYLRDDDYVPSVVSFSVSDKNEDNIINDILALEHEISEKLTQQKSKSYYNVDFFIFD